MSEPIFPDGIRVYHPSDGAPDFVKGALVIDSLKFAAWLGQQPDKVVRLDIKQSRKGPLYLQLNTYQRKPMEPVKDCPQPDQGNAADFADDDIPF